MTLHRHDWLPGEDCSADPVCVEAVAEAHEQGARDALHALKPDTTERALRESLAALGLRVTTVRGGYVRGGEHATLDSDPQAVENLAASLAARLREAQP